MSLTVETDRYKIGGITCICPFTAGTSLGITIAWVVGIGEADVPFVWYIFESVGSINFMKYNQSINIKINKLQ